MSKIKLMLVESSRGLKDALSQHFKNSDDFEIVGYSSDGIDAINVVENVKPDIVLLGMIIPKLDGIGVLEYFYKTVNIHKPQFIVISDFSQEFIVQKSMALGASYFMIKPFEVSTLIDRILTVAANRVSILSDKLAESHSEATGTMGYQGISLPTGAINLREVKEDRNAKSLEIDVTRLMHDIGVPAHIKGYQYLRDSIVLVINDQQIINAMTKILYPCIAKQHQTTPSRVERAIRHAIEVAWNRGQVEIFNEVFGYSISTGRGKPTNGEFIAMIADRVRLKM